MNLVCPLLCSLLLLLSQSVFLHPKKTIFVESARNVLLFPCFVALVSSFPYICSILSTSPAVVHWFLEKQWRERVERTGRGRRGEGGGRGDLSVSALAVLWSQLSRQEWVASQCKHVKSNTLPFYCPLFSASFNGPFFSFSFFLSFLFFLCVCVCAVSYTHLTLPTRRWV